MLRAAPVIAAIAIAPPAQATFPGPVGRIAFEQNSDIWLVNPDGSVQTQVTTFAAAAEQRPVFSPDSSRIVFSTGRDGGNQNIYVINSDGSGERQLTDDAEGAQEPAFSPDGQQIVYISHADAAGQHIWIMNADGSNQRRLTTTDTNRGTPVFTPDGQQIVYNAFGPLRRMNVDGSGDAELLDIGGRSSAPSFSPDGSRIVFQSTADNLFGEVYIANADGSGVTRLTNRPNGAQHPEFSPDGRKIVFFGRSDAAGFAFALFTMNPDGSGVEELTTVGGSVDSAPTWGSLPAAAPPPQPGVSANVSARRGTVLVKQPSSGRFVEVTAETQIPIGSLLDTTRGTVELTTARGSSGLTQTGTFKGGVFKIGQRPGGQPLTTLTLRGASLRCGSGARAAGRRSRSRRLLGNTRRGRFRTRGRNSTATVRGTKWLTKDTCAGTLTVVRQGVVQVRDLRKRRTRTRRKGQRYLARAPKRR